MRDSLAVTRGGRNSTGMKITLVAILLLGIGSAARAQAPGKWPPDSLINVKVIPKATPVMQVVGMMRNFAGALGVRCPYRSEERRVGKECRSRWSAYH